MTQQQDQCRARRIALGPGTRIEPYFKTARAWSPAARDWLSLGRDEARLMLQLDPDRNLEAQWQELIGVFAGTDPAGPRSQTEIRMFLKVEDLINHGILAEVQSLSHGDLGELIFGEHESATLDFFQSRYGANWHSVPIRDLPHASFLADGMPADDGHSFAAFIDALIGLEPEEARQPAGRERRRQVAEGLVKLHRRFASADDPAAEMAAYPLQVCRRPDGRLALLNRADLASVAWSLGLDVQVFWLKPGDFLGRAAENPGDFFGTLRGGIPYQSIFHKGEELVRGRRPDLYERLDRVAPEDLAGKRVLDLGCNIGMNSYIAAEKGAAATLGIDYERNLIDAALRLNAYFAAPSSFLARDLNQPQTGIGAFDTVFVFALLGHLKSPDGLLGTIRDIGAKTVYFESHCDIQPQGDVDGFLKSGLFAEPEFLGHGFDNAVKQTRTRRFYRLRVV